MQCFRSRNIIEGQKSDLSFAYWQLPWFARAARQINLIEIGRKRFMLGLVQVTSDCGITAECIVWTSQSIPPQRIFAHFVGLGPCAKTQSVTLTDFFVAQTFTIGEQKISPKSVIFKRIFTDYYYSGQTPYDYPGLVVVAVLVQNMLEYLLQEH